MTLRCVPPLILSNTGTFLLFKSPGGSTSSLLVSFCIFWYTTMISCWYWRFQSSKNFLRSKLSPFLICVHITFVSKFIISTFIYKLFFAYDRKQWFLVGTGGFSRLNFFRSYFGPISKFSLSPNSFYWPWLVNFLFSYFPLLLYHSLPSESYF